MSPVCQVCKRSLVVGESAWVSDWTVIDLDGNACTEFRYTCDECEELK